MRNSAPDASLGDGIRVAEHPEIASVKGTGGIWSRRRK